jgi:phosphoserine phosphatase RsbU/P
MRVLIGWDNSEESDLISLYLNAQEETAFIAGDSQELIELATNSDEWDVILITTKLPDDETAFNLFQELRKIRPDCPIVGACHTEDVFRLARFLTNGMRSYVLRDLGGDFVFLLQTTLESTVQAVHAEREQRIAERMREEIDSVRQFQESILPRDLTAPSGYEIAACYEPSQIRELGGQPVILAGGDYYDFIQINKNNVMMLVGDAAGHGMRACMSIMTMQTLMHMIRSKRYRKTSAFVEEVNRRFSSHSVNILDGSLITLLYGVLQTDKHVFQWTSAGHPIPLLLNCETGEVIQIETTDAAGTPIGVDDTMKYGTFKTKIPPRHRLLLFSDGLVEAFPHDDQSNLFGLEGLKETLRRTINISPQEALQALLDDSHEHTQGAGRHDDTSALLLERLH